MYDVCIYIYLMRFQNPFNIVKLVISASTPNGKVNRFGKQYLSIISN